MALRVKHQLTIADGFQRFREFGRVGQSVFTPRLAPQADDRPHRHVECSVRALRQLLRAFQNEPQVCADLDGPSGAGGL